MRPEGTDEQYPDVLTKPKGNISGVISLATQQSDILQLQAGLKSPHETTVESMVALLNQQSVATTNKNSGRGA